MSLTLTKELHEKRLNNLAGCISLLTNKVSRQLSQGVDCSCTDLKDLKVLIAVQEFIACYDFVLEPEEDENTKELCMTNEEVESIWQHLNKKCKSIINNCT